MTQVVVQQIDVVGACLTGFQHTGDQAALTGMGDGIFKNGFDP